jgi:hypothetical protein
MRILLACSSGGHLAQLYRLRAWWQQHERSWVTFADPQTESLLEGETVVPAFPMPSGTCAWPSGSSASSDLTW